MLLVIYPTTEKSVNEINCYFLLALAHEYQVSTVIEKCKRCLLEALKSKQGSCILDMLFVAQRYSLENVLDECIKKSEKLSFEEMQGHIKYGQIEPLSQRKMIELRLLKVEAENKRLKYLAGEAQIKWQSIVQAIGGHVCDWTSHDMNGSLRIIKNDVCNYSSKSSRTCKSLAAAYEPLRMLGKKLYEIMGIPQELIE